MNHYRHSASKEFQVNRMKTALCAALFLLALGLLLPEASTAAACTPGTDCYCDKVKASSNPIHDPNLLFCQDWEAPTLYTDTGVGGGAPYYGPWYDERGGSFTCFRGYNSYWNRNYGPGVDDVMWLEGTPAAPTKGCTCNTGGAGSCNVGAWSPSDMWQANSFAAIAILRNGDFNDEISSLGSGPSNTSDGGNGVFDGVQSFAHRMIRGRTQGITGEAAFAASTTFGITMAIAYAANVDTSGIVGAPWKPDEWRQVASSPYGPEGILMGHVSRSSINPFQQNAIYLGLMTEAQCNTAINNASKKVGTMQCDSVTMRWFADSRVYSRDTDYPLGSWGCVRAFFQNLNTGSSTLKIWFTGPAGVEKTLVDISGLDMRNTYIGKGLQSIVWNAYANANSGLGETPTTETTFRYTDNIHITAGVPVSCAQIGFGSGGGTVLAPPTNLRVN